jgi:LCP family protein required for cell wall assembly
MNLTSKSKNIILSLIALSICGLLIACFLLPKKKIQVQKTPKKITDIKLDKAMSILVLGADSLIPGELNGWHGRSDFIAVIYINPHTDKVHILSIPRDTKISLKKGKINRINAANELGGYKLARKAVEKLTAIKIDYVLVFSIQSVIDLLNEFGEFKIYVPKNLSYHDNKAHLDIEINAGLRSMNGSELIKFLRFRNKDLGDIGRIKRQQVFFRAALKKLKEKDSLIKLPKSILNSKNSFISDMNSTTMFRLGILLRSLNAKNFESNLVPGDFGKDGSWIANEKQLKKLVKKITNNEPAKK